MAAYTSTQTGNFSDSATWGGGGSPSANGDTFQVSTGHTVTIDSGLTSPSSGFGDSNVYGILQSQSGATNMLRMNGLLRIRDSGTIHLRAGATVEITGGSSNNHGVQCDGSSDIILEGSDGMTTTTLSGSVNELAESFTFSSATNFAEGEWFCIFDNQTDYAGTDQYQAPPQRYSDEGFWVHDKSGNTVYFRRFVSPPDVTISSVAGATVGVSNVKRLRVDDKVIFGTGDNRNIKSISSINYPDGLVTFTSNVSGSTVGATVYLTGTEKRHKTNDKVRKVCTVTTVESSRSSTEITVANIDKFAVGDEIWIERRGECDGTTDNIRRYNHSNYRAMHHTISSISSNKITVDSQIAYTVVEGALVNRLTRDVTFKCTTPDTDHAHFYALHNSTWGNGKLVMKDVYFKDWGNDSSGTIQGVVLRGYRNTDSLPVTLTETVPSLSRGNWIEGVIVNNFPDSTHQRDWGPIWLYDLRGTNMKCCMTLHGDDGISTYYEPAYNVFNCITTGADSFGMRFEGLQHQSEIGYMYSSGNHYGFRIYNPYDQGSGCHNFIADANEYAMSPVHSGPAMLLRNSKITATSHGPYTDGGRAQGTYSLNKVFIKYLTGNKSVDGTGDGTRYIGSVWGQGIDYGGPGPLFLSVEHNWEIDAVRGYAYHLETYYDVEEDAWRVFRRDNSSGNATFGQIVYVPAGTGMKVQASVKMAPSFSGTRPYLMVYSKIMDRVNGGTGMASSSSIFSGYRQTSQYSSSADSDYETITLTVPAVKHNLSYGVAVVSTSSNAAEGYFIKDFKVLLDLPYKNKAMANAMYANTIRNQGILVNVGTTFDSKTRLGGRLS